MTPTSEVRLDMDARSARVARRFVIDSCCQAHATAVMDQAELLVSELVTNAIQHGFPPVVLQVECDADHDLTVRVCDGSSDPPIRQDADTGRESGRGVSMVDLISDTWGVQLIPDGKCVWFVLTTLP